MSSEYQDNYDQELKLDKKAGFFRVCMNAIYDIAKKYEKPEHIAAYIVLSRYSPGLGQHVSKISTSGIKAITTKANISRITAKNVLEDLQADGFISDRTKNSDHNIPLHLGKKQGRGNTIRWIFNQKYWTGDFAFFPNALVDGINNNIDGAPLNRIMKLSGTAKSFPNEIRLDTLMVLLNLYFNHHLFDCGGVNPMHGICKDWGNADTFDYYGDLKNVYGLTYSAVDAKSKNTIISAKTDFIHTSLPYIKDKETRRKRFYNAFINILYKKLGYVYEVLQIWDSDPLDKEYAKVLYPVYIFNNLNRNKEPSLYKIINQSMVKIFELVPSFINPHTYGGTKDMDGIFVYVKPVDSEAFPLSVFRLKYKPNTEDTARWIERDNDSVEEWKNVIEDTTEQYLWDNGIYS